MKLLYNAQIYTENNLIEGFLWIENEKIKSIHTGAPTTEELTAATEHIDCQKGYLLPGFIDTHVHFRDFQQFEKETLESGSKAALSGGVTTVLTMPNTNPPLSTSENLQKYHHLFTEEEIYCNIGMIAGIKEGFSPKDIESLIDLGIYGLKVYPGDASVDLPLEWPDGWKTDLLPTEFEESFETLCRNFKHEYPNWRKLYDIAKKFDIPVIFHPELPSPIEDLNKKLTDGLAISEVIQAPNPHLFALDVQHPIYANELSHVEMVVSITRKFYPDPKNAPKLHFVHISSPEAAEVLEIILKKHGYQCSYEITPHHMLLNYNSPFENENYGKVLVPLRAPRFQEEILKMVQTGRNDVIGTDHAPHTKEEKLLSFELAPAGFPSIDFAGKILFSQYLQGKLSLDHLVNGYSTKPAEIFQLSHKGQIAPNFDADLVLIHEVPLYSLQDSHMNGKQQWSPWLGYQINAEIGQVWISGNEAYNSKNKTMLPYGKKLMKLVQ